jgi:hypothetical protein
MELMSKDLLGNLAEGSTAMPLCSEKEQGAGSGPMLPRHGARHSD